MNGPQKFVEFLDDSLYHPRSDAHGNAICRLIVMDLLASCPPLAGQASSGQLVGSVNLTQTVGHDTWNIDLALGPPAGAPKPPGHGESIRSEKPAFIQLALEAKGIMTKHGKARRNRLRDFQAFHEHAHRYSEKTIAVAVVVVNASRFYWSPTRREDDVTEHKNLPNLIKETVDVFRSLPQRERPSSGPGLEAICVLVVEHDNLKKNPNLAPEFKPQKSRLVTSSPAPAVGDPLNYASMIYRVCEAYKERFR